MLRRRHRPFRWQFEKFGLLLPWKLAKFGPKHFAFSSSGPFFVSHLPFWSMFRESWRTYPKLLSALWSSFFLPLLQLSAWRFYGVAPLFSTQKTTKTKMQSIQRTRKVTIFWHRSKLGKEMIQQCWWSCGEAKQLVRLCGKTFLSWSLLCVEIW